LAPLLQQAGVRVAVLGACNTGRRDGISPWTTIAPALVERGIGAVVAYQYEILDHAAIEFSRMFYSALAAGFSVDEAVATGRLAILSACGPDDCEWGIPVLYMRSINGRLLHLMATCSTANRKNIERVIRQIIGTIEAGGEVVGITLEHASGPFRVEQRATTVKGKLTGAELDSISQRKRPPL
jgi:CHAT domain-containing protein